MNEKENLYDELLYQYGLDICEFYKEKVIDRKTEENASFYNFSKTKHLNITENYLLRKISKEKDATSLFIFIITTHLPKVYPREGNFLKLRYYDSFNNTQIKKIMNLKHSSFYRLRKKAFIELGKIYLDINGEDINYLKRNK